MKGFVLTFVKITLPIKINILIYARVIYSLYEKKELPKRFSYLT